MLDMVEELFQKGVEFHKSGKVEVACQLYTAVLKAHPEHPTANHNMGVLAVDDGKVQEALPFFEAALEANADTAQFWLSYIDALINVERISDAQAVFGQAKNNGAQGDGFDQLERRLNVSIQEPLETSNTALVGYQDQPNILDSLKLDQAISLAKKKAKAGSTDEAKSVYQDILTKFPKNKRAIDGLKGQVGRPVGKSSKAEDAPKDELQSLIALYNNGQLALVVEQAQILTKQYPKAFAVWNLMGASATQIGQLDQAIFAFKKALAVKPDNAAAYNNMGHALKDQGKLEEAIEAYNKALAIKPDYASAIHQLGKLYKQLGQANESKKYFEKALSLGPEDTLGVNLELALLGQKEIPSKTPQAYMKEYYKEKANHWGEGSTYNGHVLIEDAFNSLRMEQNFANILDLGCGTGSLAPHLRPYSKNLDGVDLSPDMIKHAKETELYDAVYQQEIETYLGEIPNQYDVVVAAAVLIHFFDLHSILSLIRNSLTENGKLIFSVFEGVSSDKELNEFLMYSHSAKYINDLANLLGFQIQYKKTAIHEYHKGNPISALVYILQK